MKRVVLKSGREESIRRRHPWLFSGAVHHVTGAPEPGETVSVETADGTRLAIGAFSPHSQIRVRLWCFDATATIDDTFFADRIAVALACRKRLAPFLDTDARRLVNGEADGLPGLIVDQYADFLVCQFLSAGTEAFKGAIVAALDQAIRPAGIYERSDTDARKKEGLLPAAGVLAGAAPPETVEIREGPCRYRVDVQRGHKTGFYLDQRENRRILATLAAGRTVLNCFAYTGGFGVRALVAGAREVTHIEASAVHAEAITAHLRQNDLDPSHSQTIVEDAFRVLRRFRDEGRQFDIIVLDPPKFVEARRHLARGSRGYKDINWLACRLLSAGGILMTYSCSGLMPLELFQKIVADAALDAGRHGRILARAQQAPDHPASLNFPEGHYLKGLICQVD